VKLLLDTHALLWWLSGDAMADDAVAAIASPDTLVVVSAASVWEAAIKASLGKLVIPGSLADAVVDEGFEPLPVTAAHGERAGALPPHHRDPFDRLLVAQAQAEGLTLMSRDPAFRPYDVAVRPC
jgi:PIN domain nuclease of toxin-antitoxin system